MFSQKKILIEGCSKKLSEKEKEAELKMAKESEEEKCIQSEKGGERE